MEILKKKCHLCGEKIEGVNDQDFKKKFTLHLLNKHNIQIGHVSWDGTVLKIHKKEVKSEFAKKLEKIEKPKEEKEEPEVAKKIAGLKQAKKSKISKIIGKMKKQ